MVWVGGRGGFQMEGLEALILVLGLAGDDGVCRYGGEEEGEGEEFHFVFVWSGLSGWMVE